jgi:hypothetical protein
MASRPILSPYLVVTNGNMSSQIISTPTVIQNLSMISYDISWTGASPVGIVSVQASNTFTQNAAGQVSVIGNWNTLPLSITPAVSGNTGNGFIDIDQLSGYAVRLVYTPASGTGIMNVTVSGKVQ